MREHIMFKSALLAIVVSALSLAASAQAPQPPSATAASGQTPEAITEAFLEAVGQGRVEDAYGNLPKGVLWDSQADKLNLLIRQTKASIDTYGGYLGIEKIREVSFSPSIVKLTYLMKRERAFFAWSLWFYKPKDRWEFSAVVFFDQVAALE